MDTPIETQPAEKPVADGLHARQVTETEKVCPRCKGDGKLRKYEKVASGVTFIILSIGLTVLAHRRGSVSFWSWGYMFRMALFIYGSYCLRHARRLIECNACEGTGKTKQTVVVTIENN